MKAIGNEQFVNDFLRGQQAYLDHEPCDVKQSLAWQRGWGAEYERHEVMTALSEQRPLSRRPNICIRKS